ncbi:MAG: aldehyde dehydrogenase family protein [Mycobacterium sp.]|nr:aldehyde dehydrogenase family protein [Mycobacterium sp.]
MVILDDADLELAVDASIFGSFFHQGQICMIANRIIADAVVHDQFVERFVARAKALVVGDPADPSTQLGPIIDESQLESIRDKLRRAVDDGAELFCGGGQFGPTGLAMPPHVLLGGNDTATAREEVFGPVMTVIRAGDEAEALRLANDTPYGLSSAVLSSDVERAVRFARRVEAGMTHVNDSPVNDDANTAFGGERHPVSAVSGAGGRSRNSPPNTGSPFSIGRAGTRPDPLPARTSGRPRALRRRGSPAAAGLAQLRRPAPGYPRGRPEVSSAAVSLTVPPRGVQASN